MEKDWRKETRYRVLSLGKQVFPLNEYLQTKRKFIFVCYDIRNIIIFLTGLEEPVVFIVTGVYQDHVFEQACIEEWITLFRKTN